MTSTETFNAGQVRKAEAAAQVKNAEPRRAEDDSRFTEELRANRAEEKRQTEERIRERKSDEARQEETRKADAREATARSEEARAEDARADKAQEEKSREEHASDQSEDAKTASADAKDGSEGVEATAQQVAEVETVTGAEAAETTIIAETADSAETDHAVAAASAENIITAEKAAIANAATNKAEAAATAEKQNTAAAATAAAKTSDGRDGQAKPDSQPASAAVKPTAGNAPAAPATDNGATSAQAALRDAAATPVETEVTAASTSAQAAGKRGLGHATAESMQDAKTEAKPTPKSASATQVPETAASTDKPTTMAQAAQRTSASEIALQAILAKPAGTPQDIRVAGLDGAASTPLQATDSAAPAPSVTVRAIVAASAQPGTPVQPQTPAREIAINMAKNLGNGTNRFEIRLDPAELGRIDVRMELGTDGRVQAHLTVDKPETLEMLQRDARSLEKALSDAGLDMENGSLSYSMRDDNDGAGFAANRDTAEDSSGKTPTEDELAADLAAVQHIYALKAGSGSGVDIRI